MKDGIIAESKNSRIIKSTLPATYEEFKALVEGDGLPLDLLFNAAGWAQLPTFLSKANLLSDETAALLGLSGDVMVDQAFAALAGALTSAQIQTGTYVGTGTVGSSNPTVIDFGFVPRLVMISVPGNAASFYEESGVGVLWFEGVTAVRHNYNSGSNYIIWTNFAVDGTSLKLWGSESHTGDYTPTPTAASQYNTSGTTYAYIGIGNGDVQAELFENADEVSY